MTKASGESRLEADRGGRATTFLVLLSAALMVVLVAAFAHLVERQDALRDGIREDALWAVYQLDREARALAIALDRAALTEPFDADGLDELGLRYDILYSRLSILANGKYENSLATSTVFREGRGTVRAHILGVQPFFDALEETAALDRSGLPAVLAEVGALVRVTERMLVDTNAAVASARADARAEVLWIQKSAAALVLVIAVTLALLVVSLMRQLHFTRRARQQIEDSSRELAAAYEAAAAGYRAKSDFMAVMGHEIRTPLNAILGMAELLADADLPEEDRNGVRVITSSGEALLEIINEILDFARIEHGDILLEKVPFDAGLLARDAIAIVAGRAAEQGDTLAFTMDGTIPATTFLSDPTRLRRVLLNLLSNAVKFTHDGHVELRMSVPAPGRLRFEVTDTGIGISAEALPRLFNPFTQEDTTISRRFGGTGLGLAICKRVVEAMGGVIGVESTPGAGSRFWFEIPAEATEAPAVCPLAAQAASAPVPVLDVLVVEDNHVNRVVARRFLEKLGQRVTMAVDGAEGVALAREGAFDLILMDMQMPVLDGIAAARQIRAEEAAAGRRARIVAMTANASDTDRALCAAVGMDAFVAKPVTLARLADILRATPGSDRPLMALPAEPATPVADMASRDDGIDAGRRAELAETFGVDGLRELDESFFTDMAQLLRDLHAALAGNDRPAADGALHTIKGAASNLGYADLSAFAHEARRTLDAAVIEAELERRVASLARGGEAARAA